MIRGRFAKGRKSQSSHYLIQKLSPNDPAAGKLDPRLIPKQLSSAMLENVSVPATSLFLYLLVRRSNELYLHYHNNLSELSRLKPEVLKMDNHRELSHQLSEQTVMYLETSLLIAR